MKSSAVAHVGSCGGARRRLAVGAGREWECIVVRAPLGKLRELRVNLERRMGLTLFP